MNTKNNYHSLIIIIVISLAKRNKISTLKKNLFLKIIKTKNREYRARCTLLTRNQTNVHALRQQALEHRFPIRDTRYTRTRSTLGIFPIPPFSHFHPLFFSVFHPYPPPFVPLFHPALLPSTVSSIHRTLKQVETRHCSTTANKNCFVPPLTVNVENRRRVKIL